MDWEGGSEMAETRQPGRREMLGMAALGGAALLSGAAAPELPAPAAPPDLWASSYWASKRRDGQEVRLAMYRKRGGAPVANEAPRPVLLLVHGSSPAALASFETA